ncbi:hypothetical protein BKA62DRAFT_746332 [Auriculariales sp. MPI-PUGE-AT-0066]|nr:hypothetical protein BKA62DRAFT_746332 [Auriculariales sp. MPI-PUGE-AT-0066]
MDLTGSCWGQPRIRSRPLYSNLPGDSSTDRSVVTEEVKAAGIGCSKFYETYGIHGQTSGIMAAWCPHLVCLGFHCIPKGEGRNDVFSVLYCYWEVPPRYVIYDFACALAPYCMARKPEFFQDTIFLIDGFHAKGHKRCTNTSMVSFYQLYNPKLRAINCSSIQCSVSYMSQRHAIIYILTFLCLWNPGTRAFTYRR